MEKPKVTFWSLLLESIIVQSLITVLVVCVTVYLYVIEGVIPEGLERLTYVIVSFWMGAKSQSALGSYSQKRR